MHLHAMTYGIVTAIIWNQPRFEYLLIELSEKVKRTNEHSIKLYNLNFAGWRLLCSRHFAVSSITLRASRICLIGNIFKYFNRTKVTCGFCQTIKSKERMNISEWRFWHVETKQVFYWFGNQKRLRIEKRFQSQNSLYKGLFNILYFWR